MAHYMGFCVMFLHLDATMEHAMDPITVAKYMGFQEAKGNKPSTINKVGGGGFKGWGCMCASTTMPPSHSCPHLPLPSLSHRLPTSLPT